MAHGHRCALYGLLLAAVFLAGCDLEGERSVLPYEDDFSGSCDDWGLRDDEEARLGCTGGQYRILFRDTSKTMNRIIVRDMDEPVQSIGLEAEAGIYASPRTSPDDLVAFGLVCSTRSDPGDEQGYFLWVAPDLRIFAIDKGDANGPKSTYTRLEDGQLPSSAIDGTDESIHLRAECRQEGDQAVLTMWVNGEQVAVVKDPHGYHGYISFGFFATSPKRGADFRFDSFAAEELD